MKTKKHFLARRLDGKHASFWVSVLAVVLTLITASLLLLIMQKNPLTALFSFLQGCGLAPKARYGGGSGMLSDLSDFLNYLAPMLFASLAFIVAFKTGLFNIGISGQMLLSGFLALVLVGYSKNLSPFAAKPLALLIGIAAGGLLGALVGFLKYKFNIHEVVSTIMLNYIISYLTGFFINNNYVDMLTRNSRVCTPASRLTLTDVLLGGVRCKLPIGILLSLAAAAAVWFLFEKTTFGFEMKAVGQNPGCARYVGVSVGRSIVWSMALSGLLAGLAGVTYYLGYTNAIVPKVLPGMGYDSISVALLGNSSPIGAILAAFIVSIFQQGANYMSSQADVAKEIASLITGILLLFAACGTYMRVRAHAVLMQEEDREEDRRRAAASAEQAGEAADGKEGRKDDE